MREIVDDLKILNAFMKNYLEQEKIQYESMLRKKQAQYTTISKKISVILETMIEDISQIFLKKQSLTQQEQEIVQHLIKIRSENQKLKDFPEKSFHSEEEMLQYLRKHIRNIQQEIQAIKKLS